jgi:hypothetical protein
MTLLEAETIFTRNIARLIEHIFSCGYKCTLGEAFRTKEQAEINANKGIGIKDSLHRKRLAIDINLFSPEGKYLSDTKDYELFGIYWESLHKHNRWGGKFKRADGNHFEMQEV